MLKEKEAKFFHFLSLKASLVFGGFFVRGEGGGLASTGIAAFNLLLEH